MTGGYYIVPQKFLPASVMDEIESDYTQGEGPSASVEVTKAELNDFLEGARKVPLFILLTKVPGINVQRCLWGQSVITDGNPSITAVAVEFDNFAGNKINLNISVQGDDDFITVSADVR